MDEINVLWVTQDCFVDHDIDIVPYLSNYVRIHWVILIPFQGARYKESDFDNIIRNNSKLILSFIRFRKRMRYPQNIFTYGQILELIKSETPDIVHIDLDFVNPWALPTIFRLPISNTIMVVHQGEVHSGMKHHKYDNFIREKLFSRIKYVKMFSKHQADIFEKKFPSVKQFRFTLPLIKYGDSSVRREFGSLVRFLSFGIINYAKNIDLLIDAAEALYDEGERDFVVSINGGCGNWQFYADRIKHPEIFETDIRLIPNEAIPDLFTKSHFFVQPYRVVSQSGPLKIAYAYNTPVIVSDLPGFTDEVKEGVSGFVFEHENIESLKAVMRKAMNRYRTNYDNLLNSMKEYVHENYSEEKMADNYLKMFNTVLKNGK